MTSSPSTVATNQATHSDTPEALAVSNMTWAARNPVTSGYSRERHLLLTAPPQIAVQAGGTPVGPDAPPRLAFAAAGCDFVVSERPLAVNLASPEDDPRWRGIKTHKAIVRDDTKTTLGVVGRSYHPVQNEALINLFEFLREDAELQNIVALDGGRKVFATATINIEGAIREGDIIRRHIHAFNSFDGTTSFGVCFSDMALVCSNQLRYISGRGARKAKAEGQGLVLRHTAQVKQFVDKLPQLINLQQQTFQQDLAALRPLLTTRITPEAARAVLEATYADKLANPVVDKETKEKRERTLADLEATDIAQIRSHAFGSTGIGIDPAERSLWNLFQAITQHETHETGRARDAVEAARVRLESLFGGAASQRIDRAREACLALAG